MDFWWRLYIVGAGRIGFGFGVRKLGWTDGVRSLNLNGRSDRRYKNLISWQFWIREVTQLTCMPFDGSRRSLAPRRNTGGDTKVLTHLKAEAYRFHMNHDSNE